MTGAPLLENGVTAMETQRFSRPVLVFMVAAPLGWGILLLFHPNPTQDIHAGLHHQVTPWLVVHLGTLLGIGLVGVVLTLLVRDLPGRAAAISLWAVLPYVLFYGAAEAIQGAATAVLVRYANSVPDAERPTAAGAVQALWDDVVVDDLIGAPGAVAWLVAIIAAAVAYRHAGAPWGVTILLGRGCGGRDPYATSRADRPGLSGRGHRLARLAAAGRARPTRRLCPRRSARSGDQAERRARVRTAGDARR